MSSQRTQSRSPRWNRKIPAKPLKVDPENNPWDRAVSKYAAGGMATTLIIAKAKEAPGGKELTDSQITYRLRAMGFTKENGCSRMDFRNGRSPFCEHFFKALETPSFERELHKHLRDMGAI